MDFATIAGIIAGAVLVFVAIFLGGDFMLFVDVQSVLLVVGGAIAATMIRFPLSCVIPSLAVGAKVAFTQRRSVPREVIEEISQLADVVRRQGPLGLESVVVKNEFLAQGIQYIADGYEESFIRESLERERDLYLERLEDGQRMFKAIGDSAPAFGMIGTLVGLVQMLANMSDPSAIGPAMAVALLTTLYGALIANLVALPICDKLALKAKIEDLNQTLVVDGIMQIREGKSPQLIKEMLKAYIPEQHREQIAALAT